MKSVGEASHLPFTSEEVDLRGQSHCRKVTQQLEKCSTGTEDIIGDVRAGIVSPALFCFLCKG